MSDAPAAHPYRVGAVAYHPRVVTIWEGFGRWFAERDFPIEHTLFSSYDAQVEALLSGAIDVAWNTNLAYVQTRARTNGACHALAMRDTDRNWTSVVLVPEGAGEGLAALRGRRVGFGDADSPQAWILPAFALRREGLDLERDLVAERLDLDVGKHGDTGAAERAQVERLLAGELDAAVVSSPTLAALRGEGRAAGLSVAWTSPAYHHCNFTALDGSPAPHDRFRLLLLEMDATDARLCEAMQLEWVNRWVEADESGYDDLIAALHAFGRA